MRSRRRSRSARRRGGRCTRSTTEPAYGRADDPLPNAATPPPTRCRMAGSRIRCWTSSSNCGARTRSTASRRWQPRGQLERLQLTLPTAPRGLGREVAAMDGARPLRLLLRTAGRRAAGHRTGALSEIDVYRVRRSGAADRARRGCRLRCARRAAAGRAGARAGRVRVRARCADRGDLQAPREPWSVGYVQRAARRRGFVPGVVSRPLGSARGERRSRS